MQNVNEIETGFQFTAAYGSRTETLTIIEIPGKIKGFRMTSDIRSGKLLCNKRQMAEYTGLAY